VLPFFVRREQASGGSLLGEATIGITLVGSSYSSPFYGFADALRYTLQRDVLVSWVSAVQGSWVGMETYLRDDSFQTKKPKLILWEMPSRGINASPDYKYREDRYHSDNIEWLLRASAWAQGSCSTSPVGAKIVAGDLAESATDNVSVGKTTDKNFIELSFDKPIQKLDYLVASLSTSGSKKILLEASGAGAETRWIDVQVPGDGAEHVFKTPLPSYGKGFTKLRIFPGRSSTFTFKGLQVCRQPEELLK
jgi:alginate O-acetyltransferase complex protein AlgJ